MNTYETTATVEDHGQLHVAGVPFEAGTEVEVTIKPARDVGGATAADDQLKRQAARALLSATDVAFSAQVLQEFYAVAVTKQRLQMTHHRIVPPIIMHHHADRSK